MATQESLVQMDELVVLEADTANTGLLRFARDACRRISGWYLLWLLMSLGASVVVYTLWRGRPVAALGPSQTVYYLIVGIHILFRIRQGGRAAILAPDMIFIGFYSLFHLGYLTLFTLDIVPYSREIIFYEQSIPKSLLVLNLGLIGFLFGYEILGYQSASYEPDIPQEVPHEGWGILGIFLMIVGLGMHFMGLLTLGFDIISKYGYAGIAGAYRYASYFTVLMLTFYIRVTVLGVSIYTIYSILRYRKLFHSRFIRWFTYGFIILLLLEGERGGMLKIILPIMLIRHYLLKPIRIRYILLLIIGVWAVGAGVKVVRTLALAPTEMWEEYKYRLKAGDVTWYNLPVEMGGSYMTLNITTNDVPTQEPYWYGASWSAAAIHVVPFLQGFLFSRGFLKMEPSDWVTITYFGFGTPGRGFSLAAEGYLNFGYLGTFIELMLLGMFIRWLTRRFSRRPTAAWAFIMLGCMGPVFLAVRDHLNIVTQQCMIVFLIAALLHFSLRSRSLLEEPYEPYETMGDLQALSHSQT